MRGEGAAREERTQVIGRVPVAVWLSLPGLVALAWFALHEPPAAALEAELSDVEARIDGLADVATARDELQEQKELLTGDIEMLQWFKQDVTPFGPSVNDVLPLLPKDLTVSRLVAEEPAWTLRFDLIEPEPALVQEALRRVGELEGLRQALFLEPHEGGPALHVELLRPPRPVP